MVNVLCCIVCNDKLSAA